MSLTDLIKGKSIDELDVILDSGEEMTIKESYDLVAISREEGAKLKQSGFGAGVYLGTAFLYLLVDKMKKEGISDEARNAFLNSKEAYQAFLCESSGDSYRAAQKKVLEVLEPIKNISELKKIQEVVSEYRGFLSALTDNYAAQFGENMNAIKKGDLYYRAEFREGKVAHDFGQVIRTIFDPMNESFGLVKAKTDYAKPAKDLFKQWGLM